MASIRQTSGPTASHVFFPAEWLSPCHSLLTRPPTQWLCLPCECIPLYRILRCIWSFFRGHLAIGHSVNGRGKLVIALQRSQIFCVSVLGCLGIRPHAIRVSHSRRRCIRELEWRHLCTFCVITARELEAILKWTVWGEEKNGNTGGGRGHLLNCWVCEG